MSILFILLVPAILTAAPLLVRQNRSLGYLSAAGYFVVLALSIRLILRFLARGAAVSLFNFIYLDALSLFFVFVIALVTFAVALYSVDFVAREAAGGAISEKKARLYYSLFNSFALAMLLVVVVNNLGIMWVAIELTTLVSAFLVGFYNSKDSLEAAWKYIIICSVGIILALLGTILFAYALLFQAGVKSLNWTELIAAAGTLVGNLLKVAFIFILVGYGTKAGLAPMHPWLPDAHSPAISPISALLSGVLLKTALYAILRYSMIVNQCLGPAYTGRLLLLFGLISLAVSAGFILVQKDLKRLLAYSSIEHVGIIAIGFGLGGPLGTYGALFHILNHAAAKSLMFFGAGNIVKKYGTHNIHIIKGVLRVLPLTGAMLLVGIFALTGLPPFSIFFSELMVLAAAFLKGSYLVAGLMLLFLSIIFGAILHHFSQMLFGKKPADQPAESEPLTGKAAFIFLLFFICGLGWLMPGPLNQLLLSASTLLRGR